MEKINLFRTDLAYDEVEYKNLISSKWTTGGIRIHKLDVDEELSKKINKKVGVYYTIDLSENNIHDYQKSEIVEKEIGNVIKEMLLEKDLVNKKCLVVGLGNINVTPDSLGPFCLDNIIVTRHLFKEQIANSKYSEVCGISPGVMGSTGIETFDIIKSIVDDVDVDFCIVVDALCSSSIDRVNRTVQITNTGISPGSGVGNRRKEISLETLGIPVIAVGIPTVVDFVTITSDVMDKVVDYLASKGENKDYNYFGDIGKLSEDDKKHLISEVIENNNMIVTPKDIDIEVEDLSKIIAMSINRAVHNLN